MKTKSHNPRSADNVRLDQATSRQVVSLLSQLVTSTDLLRVEARRAGCGELAGLLAHAGALALEGARYSDQLPMFEEAIVHLRLSVEKIFGTVQKIQRAAAVAAHQPRIAQELLDIEVTTLRLGRLVGLKTESNARDHVTKTINPESRSRVLVVDDDEGNRDIIARLLQSEPYEMLLASSGDEALEILHKQNIDLLLLDVLMPGMDGIAVLRRLREDPACTDVPVIMLSGVDQINSVITCLELGARDYLSKPFHPVLLKARLQSALEHRKLILGVRTRAREVDDVLQQLREANSKGEAWLRSVLPAGAAEELLQSGSVTPRYHEDVTIVFTDFVQFTTLCSNLSAYELVETLNEYFTEFDRIVKTFGLERLKTVGDAYIFVSGLTKRTPSHPIDAVLAAMDMLAFVSQRARRAPSWEMRVGVNTGPVVSGVVGTDRPAFDVWGDTVNLASRMVSSGKAGRINISEQAFQRIKDLFACESRGAIEIKGGRSMEMFFISGPHASVLAADIDQRPGLFRARYRSYFESDLATLPAGLFVYSESPQL